MAYPLARRPALFRGVNWLGDVVPFSEGKDANTNTLSKEGSPTALVFNIKPIPRHSPDVTGLA
jgi:hypothetical protein